jgi:hypothetical protein
LRKAFLFSQFAHSFPELLLNLRFTLFIHLVDGIITDDNESTDFTYLWRNQNDSSWFCISASTKNEGIRKVCTTV